ncbi:MAG: hypothetical protein ACRDNF_12925 [Streptosporangiaceae bacterium]
MPGAGGESALVEPLAHPIGGTFKPVDTLSCPLYRVLLGGRLTVGAPAAQAEGAGH